MAKTQSIRLEINQMRILVPKENWQIYFLVLAEDERGNWQASTLPDMYIRLKPRSQNQVNFLAEGKKSEGMTLLERSMPVDRHLRVRLYIMHSRQRTREGSAQLDELARLAGVSSGLSTIFGNASPWLVIGKEALPLLTDYLKTIRDRQLGMINMDEEFEARKSGFELVRSNKSSTGEVEIVWRWNIDPMKKK